MDDSRGFGWWLSAGSGGVTMAVAVGLVGVYAYGLSQPAERTVEAHAVLSGVAPEAVWAVVSDPALRPQWRPSVDRIARIDENAGPELWRELDHNSDRFDFVVRERVASERFVIQVAEPEQIGFDATWTWVVTPDAAGTHVSVTERGRMDNPFFRGIRNLVASPHDNVEGEIELLATYMGR